MIPEIFFFPGALLCGFGLDLLIGDPERLPHPVRLIGRLIAAGEKLLRRSGSEKAEAKVSSEKDNSSAQPDQRRQIKERFSGAVLAALIIVLTFVVCLIILRVCFWIHPSIAFALAVLMSWQCVSARCLGAEANKVYEALSHKDLPKARLALSMIVGRDVFALDEEAVSKAAMETVAENTADGVIAPLFYLAIGGPCLGMAYKAVNTLDSMIGYKNERYINFGRAAAKIDDLANYLPARIAALFMITASGILGLDRRNAYRIWKRDRQKHESPNSAHTEAVLAGALGVSLAGDATYFGKLVKKPMIGDRTRAVQVKDIKTTVSLMYGTSFLFLPVAALLGIGISALVLMGKGLAL